MALQNCKAALYIHIPFCVQKCDYCDFYSVSGLKLAEPVLNNIPLQIESLMEDHGVVSFSSVYIGGGTPGVVPPNKMAELLVKIKKLNSGRLPSEVTMECNPRNISRKNLDIWVSAGITRLSLGVQSFQDEFLKAAGRRSSRKAILNALNVLESYRDCLNISLDLIQGLPAMSLSDQIADLKEVIEWKPDHLSWYSLILEEGTPLYANWDERNAGKDADDEDVWLEGCRLLEDAGYRRYEISNFCLPGRESVHNTAYWKLHPYIGCGPAAVSMLPGENGTISRFRTKPDVLSYSRGGWSYDDVDVLTPVDFLKDYLLMGLRISEGISRREFEAVFSCQPEEMVPSSFEKWKQVGCFDCTDSSFCCSEKGMDLLNSILIDFFDEIDRTDKTLNPDWPIPSAP